MRLDTKRRRVLIAPMAMGAWGLRGVRLMFFTPAIRRLLGFLTATVMALGVVFVVEQPAYASYYTKFTWNTLQTRSPGQFSIESADSRFTATFQIDGNFVIYKKNTAIWSSHTYHNGRRITLRTNDGYQACPGSIEVRSADDIYNSWASEYDPGFKRCVGWSTTTFRLVMQSDGNLVEYTGSSGGVAVWASDTAGA
jgi:hypothetical protein